MYLVRQPLSSLPRKCLHPPCVMQLPVALALATKALAHPLCASSKSSWSVASPQLHNLWARNCVQVPGCLTESESRRFIETAERLGFQHQGSRGAAYGEVTRMGLSCWCRSQGTQPVNCSVPA